jgi:hypothetical protein
MKRWIVFLFVSTALVSTAAGCGNASGLHHVSGKVLYKGEPATGAMVSFVSKVPTEADLAQAAFGIVQEDGSFTLAGPLGEGAPAGEYVVLVEWKEGAGKVKGRSPGLNAPDRLGKRYLNLKQPLLTAVVEPKTNILPPFEVK